MSLFLFDIKPRESGVNHFPFRCKFLPTDEIVCISCSTTKPKEQITEKPSTAAFPHMTELQEIIDNPVQKKHFLAFLGAGTNLPSILEAPELSSLPRWNLGSSFVLCGCSLGDGLGLEQPG